MGTKMPRYAVYHNILEGGCGGIAFYTTRILVADVDTIYGAEVIRLDGTHPIDNYDDMICGSCNLHISGIELHYKDTNPV